VSPAFAIYLVWGLWLIAWLIAAVMGQRESGTLRGAPSFAFHLIVAVAFLLLLTLVAPFPATDLQYRLWAFGVPDGLGWVLVVIILASLGVFGWSSFHRIARLKHGARLVDSGPYTVVRHPIYLSVMIGAVTSAILFGQPTSFLGALLLIAAVIVKVVLEERATDDDAHRDYRERVPMFVPLWPMHRD
jgi:protein-S-isoprenylcysteine O-methyltransferase Ste14